MRIGNFETNGNVFLAPMAGITDLPFRLICKQYNASLLYTEMINAKAVCYEDKNTFEMLMVEEKEKPVAVQIFGNEPEFMINATRILSSLNRFSLIDINMGCPAPKVVKNGDGSKLLLDLEKAKRIMKVVVENSSVPVTVKIRKGWDKENIVAVQVAKIAEEVGISAITIHGRTRSEFYTGKADWDIIKEVKEM